MKMKKLLFIIVCAVLLTSLFGCDDFAKYRGTHDALYTEAMTSLLSASSRNGESVCIIDHDTYGKTLFAYSGDCAYRKAILALLVAQNDDDKTVSYYEDCNFIYTQVETYQFPDSYDDLLEFFTEDEIETLKSENDWNKPIDDSKTVYEPVTDKKDYYPIKNSALIKALKEIGTTMARSYQMPLCSDANGKVIYYVITPKDGSEEEKEYLFMFNKDGSVNTDTGIEELEDLWNYREQLTRFKENNGWKR